MKKMYIRFICMLLVPGPCLFSTAQNSFIFKGGLADGWVSKNYVLNNTNVFKGGNSDGWASQNFLQNASNIFKGGTSDGWSSQNLIQANTAIYKGGTSDGWSSQNVIQANTAIHKGGTSDGWSSINTIQASTAIHKGGMGDGWASTYRPQGVLPITLLTFTASRVGTTALAKWTTGTEINSDYFDVERSNDALNFVFIGKVSAVRNSSANVSYSFTDNQPLSGVNYYRLKEVDLNGHFVYSPARLVKFDSDAGAGIKYYPNPTQGMLTVELTKEMQQEEIVINISSVSGAVVDQKKLPGNNNPVLYINMAKYPVGTYFIQFKTKSSNNVIRIINNN